MRTAVSLSVLAVSAAACSAVDRSAPTAAGFDADGMVMADLRDGDLAVPADYRDWPVYLADLDKVEAKQIRDIYMNPIGHTTEEGGEFPHGTASVMEIWEPKMSADGELETDANGKLVKGELKLVFVMGKSRGAGESVAPELRNGDWVYAAYGSDGVTPGGPPAAACRTCHLSEEGKDWVFRYDQYFASRDD